MVVKDVAMKKFVFLVVSLYIGVMSVVQAQTLDISIVKLLASPEKYDGKSVRVIAYLSLEFEENALYFHREDFEKQLFSNGIGIIMTQKETLKYRRLGRSYIMVEGLFSTSHRGHLETYIGSLHSIKSLTPWHRARKMPSN